MLLALGAEMVLPGVFAVDRQINRNAAGEVQIDEALAECLEAAAERIENFYASLPPGLLNPPPVRWGERPRSAWPADSRIAAA